MLERFTWFRQSAMRYQADGLTVYIDPWGTAEDEPPADLILITHAHEDHLQPDEIARLRTATTKVFAPPDVAKEISGAVTAVAPGESHEAAGVHFETVPAYNIVEDRLDKHPKANRWVGYVLELEGSTYYHAGDTDALPELESLTTQVAMVPIGGTYTMDAEEAGGLVRAMSPRLAVPMHYGFRVGSPGDADRFRAAAAPVAVETLTPTNPFERP
jgi:L-ascorbate metabolism protein UlaG (beta-lactamase superfamily)